MDPEKKADVEYEVAKKQFLIDTLKFFSNADLLTMVVVILILLGLRLGDVITTTGFERSLLTAIISGFSADGLNNLTNLKRGD